EPDDGRADLDNLTGPFVAGDDRIRDRDDVPPLIELEVGVADSDSVRSHEDVVRAYLRIVDVREDGSLRSLKDQGFHGSPSPDGCSRRYEDFHVACAGSGEP